MSEGGRKGVRGGAKTPCSGANDEGQRFRPLYYGSSTGEMVRRIRPDEIKTSEEGGKIGRERRGCGVCHSVRRGDSGWLFGGRACRLAEEEKKTTLVMELVKKKQGLTRRTKECRGLGGGSCAGLGIGNLCRPIAAKTKSSTAGEAT